MPHTSLFGESEDVAGRKVKGQEPQIEMTEFPGIDIEILSSTAWVYAIRN
jgi:hypothetical protein